MVALKADLTVGCACKGLLKHRILSVLSVYLFCLACRQQSRGGASLL